MNLIQRNIKAIVFISILTTIGFCFGGRLGAGIALTIVLIAQLV